MDQPVQGQNLETGVNRPRTKVDDQMDAAINAMRNGQPIEDDPFAEASDPGAGTDPASGAELTAPASTDSQPRGAEEPAKADEGKKPGSEKTDAPAQAPKAEGADKPKGKQPGDERIRSLNAKAKEALERAEKAERELAEVRSGKAPGSATAPAPGAPAAEIKAPAKPGEKAEKRPHLKPPPKMPQFRIMEKESDFEGMKKSTVLALIDKYTEEGNEEQVKHYKAVLSDLEDFIDYRREHKDWERDEADGWQKLEAEVSFYDDLTGKEYPGLFDENSELWNEVVAMQKGNPHLQRFLAQALPHHYGRYLVGAAAKLRLEHKQAVARADASDAENKTLKEENAALKARLAPLKPSGGGADVEAPAGVKGDSADEWLAQQVNANGGARSGVAKSFTPDL